MVVTDPNKFVRDMHSKVQIAEQNGKRSVIIGGVYFDCQYDNEYYAEEISAYFKNRGYDVNWSHDGYGVQFQVAL